MHKSLYFQHDYNAANDHKVLFLRQQLGIEGYGIFWYVIEQLAQSGGTLPLRIIPVLAMQIQTTPDKVKSVIQNYDLFEIEQEEFFSVRLNTQLEFRKMLSSEGRKGGLKSGQKRRIEAPLQPPLEARKGKERKESKEKEIFPAELIASDEVYWEMISMQFRSQNPKQVLELWEGWYVNKFEWRKKELSEMRLSYESWLKNPKSGMTGKRPNEGKVQ